MRRIRLALTMVMAALAVTGEVHAAAPSLEIEDNLTLAFDKAKTDGRMIFIVLAKDGDRNCQALKNYIAKGEVKLPRDKFIYVALNAGDQAERKIFAKDYPMAAQTLPQVAIVDSSGKALATRPGPGRAEDFEKLIKDAIAKAGGEQGKEKADPTKEKTSDGRKKAAGASK